jgi:hypothetical protein
MLNTVPFKGTVYKTAELLFFQKSLLRSRSILNTESFKGTLSNTAELPFSQKSLPTQVLVYFEYHLRGRYPMHNCPPTRGHFEDSR